MLISAILLAIYGNVFLIILCSMSGIKFYKESNNFNYLRNTYIAFGVVFGILINLDSMFGFLLF